MAALYRIARFPINNTPVTQEAWLRGTAAYLKGGKYLDPPNAEVSIPHTHALKAEGDGDEIRANVRIPKPASKSSPVPVLIFICGLDAYRTDHTVRTSEHVRRGFACVSVDIPGTADCPSAKNDPLSPDRQWSSVLDWIESQEMFDKNKVSVRSVSTGGYYAMRIAHTHADRLRGVVSQGGGSHRMFDKEWIAAQNKMEYPFEWVEVCDLRFRVLADPD